MRQIVECVPNFSEGRDAGVVSQIADAVSSAGIALLGRELDPDHNRSVLTFAGPPDAVAAAALRAVGKAVELIDLRRHDGVHPRIGAVDVLPFVPVQNVTIEDCVRLAHDAGLEIWRRYGVPVYFYEAAAKRPDRINLENIRRGQFERLRDEIAIDPDRAPDIGEPRLHESAGAVAVGARKFLIAYNVNLRTTDLNVARAIARSIRSSSGGLPCVKAIGLPLESRGMTQVSMNLTDFEITPVHRVFEAIRTEAAQRGVEVAESEIVGLIPRKALEMTSAYFLQCANLTPERVIENRIASFDSESAR